MTSCQCRFARRLSAKKKHLYTTMLPDSKLQFFLPGSLFFVGTVLKYFVSVYKENILLIYEKQDTINFFASLL